MLVVATGAATGLADVRRNWPAVADQGQIVRFPGPAGVTVRQGATRRRGERLAVGATMEPGARTPWPTSPWPPLLAAGADCSRS